MTTPFSVTRKSPTSLHVAGRIDVENAGRALTCARENTVAADGSMHVDLSQLESADSVTLAVLLAWAAPITARGGSLVFDAIPPRLRALAHLSDAEPLLEGSVMTGSKSQVQEPVGLKSAG